MPGKWDSRGVTDRARREVARRMKRAVLVLQGEVQRKISRGQPVARIGGVLRGLDPSKPGEPPKVVSSRLKNSITHSVHTTVTEVVGRVGTNVEYARALELGFIGTDSLGRNRNLQPRPYLRSTLKEHLSPLIRILGGTPRGGVL